MEINALLRKHAEQAKWSPERIADRCGVSGTQVRRWFADQSSMKAESLLVLLRELPGFANDLLGCECQH